MKYADFTLITRSASPGAPTWRLGQMRPLPTVLLDRTGAARRRVRLPGVTVSRLEPAGAVAEPWQAMLL